MQHENRRRRAIGQGILSVAGVVVLAIISTYSVILVEKTSDYNRSVVHAVEVEGQISSVLLEIRRTESAARGYLLTSGKHFLDEYEQTRVTIVPAIIRLTQLTSDNPTQQAHIERLRLSVDTRLSEFTRAVDDARQGNRAGVDALIQASGQTPSITAAEIREIADQMHAEEVRLLGIRTAATDNNQRLASWVTLGGSGLVILLAAVSLLLVRRSMRARDEAEWQLRDNNLNLETTVQARTADLREANEEIQRFAYIVSHDLRSPLVNIMGFTSELEELRGDIFKRIAALGMPQRAANAKDDADAELQGPDAKLRDDFSEALGFIKSSIAKMDRLISAILQLTREGRREFRPVPIDTKELVTTITATVAHQAQEAEATIDVDDLPQIVSDRLAIEQIFSNLIDNALKYLRNGVPGEVVVRGKTKLGFAIFEIVDNGRGIDAKDHQRIFDLFRRAGTQDRPGQGIGLAHVRALVRRLGGTLTVASELHKGSTFTVTLPTRWTAQTRDQTS